MQFPSTTLLDAINRSPQRGYVPGQRAYKAANSIVNPYNWALYRNGSEIIGAISNVTFAYNTNSRKYEATVTSTATASRAAQRTCFRRVPDWSLEAMSSIIRGQVGNQFDVHVGLCHHRAEFTEQFVDFRHGRSAVPNSALTAWMPTDNRTFNTRQTLGYVPNTDFNQ